MNEEEAALRRLAYSVHSGGTKDLSGAILFVSCREFERVEDAVRHLASTDRQRSILAQA